MKAIARVGLLFTLCIMWMACGTTRGPVAPPAPIDAAVPPEDAEILADGGRRSWLREAPAAGTVEAYLSDQFREFAATCNIPTGANRSYVSWDVARAVGHNALKLPGEQVEIAGSSLMWLVYHEDDVETPIRATPPSSRLLLPEYNGGTDLLLEALVGYNTWGLMRSCSGYIAAAAALDLPVPSAAVKASVKAEATRKVTLTAVGGRFVSPLKSTLDRGDWKSLHARLQLWRIYEGQPSLVDNAFYMREFEGLMLVQAANVSMNADIGGNAEASLGVVRAKLQAGASSGQSLTFTKPYTLIFSDEANPASRAQRFERLPSPSEIAAALATARHLTRGPEMVLRGSFSHTYTFSVRGIPTGLCTRIWKLDGLVQGFFDAYPSPTVTTSAETNLIGELNTPECVFSITGTPSNIALNSASPILSVNIKGPELPGNTTLLIPVSKQFSTTRHPTIATAANPAPYDIVDLSSGTFKLAWSMDVGVTDSQNPVDRSPGITIPIAEQTTINCGAQSAAVPVAGTIIVGADGRYRLSFRTNTSFSISNFEIGSDGHDICDVSITVSVPLNGGASVPRSLSAQLQFPREKQVQMSTSTSSEQ